jgi:hypothetical protein
MFDQFCYIIDGVSTCNREDKDICNVEHLLPSLLPEPISPINSHSLGTFFLNTKLDQKSLPMKRIKTVQPCLIGHH